MMPAGIFETSCTYLRLVSLVMGFIIFLAALFVHLRPMSKHKLYEDENTTRATKLYLKSQHDQKGHLFWMLAIFAIVVWYTGALISSSYVTDFAVQKGGDCPAGSSNSGTYQEYNGIIVYPPALFAIGLLLAFMGNVTRGTKSKVLHALSFLSLLAGTISVVLLFRYVDVCSIAAKCV